MHTIKSLTLLIGLSLTYIVSASFLSVQLPNNDQERLATLQELVNNVRRCPNHPFSKQLEGITLQTLFNISILHDRLKTMDPQSANTYNRSKTEDSIINLIQAACKLNMRHIVTVAAVDLLGQAQKAAYFDWNRLTHPEKDTVFQELSNKSCDLHTITSRLISLPRDSHTDWKATNIFAFPSLLSIHEMDKGNDTHHAFTFITDDRFYSRSIQLHDHRIVKIIQLPDTQLAIAAYNMITQQPTIYFLNSDDFSILYSIYNSYPYPCKDLHVLPSGELLYLSKSTIGKQPLVRNNSSPNIISFASIVREAGYDTNNKNLLVTFPDQNNSIIVDMSGYIREPITDPFPYYPFGMQIDHIAISEKVVAFTSINQLFFAAYPHLNRFLRSYSFNYPIEQLFIMDEGRICVVRIKENKNLYFIDIKKLWYRNPPLSYKAASHITVWGNNVYALNQDNISSITHHDLTRQIPQDNNAIRNVLLLHATQSIMNHGFQSDYEKDKFEEMIRLLPESLRKYACEEQTDRTFEEERILFKPI